MKFGASECVVIAAVALAVGCSKVEDGDLPTKPGDVLVSVNGDTFTKGDVDELAQLSTDVETLRNKGKKDSQFDPNKYKAEFIRTCLGGFVERTLYKQVAKDLKLTVTEAECDRQLGYLMKIISVAQRGGNPVALRITEDKIKRLKRQVREELLSQKGREASIAAVPKPTENELKFRRQQIEDYNRIAEQTNALVWARATNVWEQLKGGADFKAMAKKYCEVEGGTEDGAWGEWGLVDLMNDDRSLANALTGLAVGSFTPPIEGDNGVVIVKLLSKREVTRRKDVNDKNAPMIRDIQFDLARIYFRLPMIYEMPTDAELRKVLEEMCRNDAWEQKLAHLKREAKIEWPYGTNIAERLVANLPKKNRDLPKEVQAKMPKEVKENLSKGVEL